MRTKDETDLNCSSCGACCTGSSADGDYVPVTRLDRRRLPTKYAKKLQTLPEPDESGAIEALGLKHMGACEVCIALKGTLGKAVQCDVYAQRPDHCRVFERGSVACLARRKEVFFIRPSFADLGAE